LDIVQKIWAPLRKLFALPVDESWLRACRRFWTMKQPNGCSTPAPRYSAAKQWFEQLAQKKKKQ